MGIYLICFGSSEKNLEAAINYKVIGVNQKRLFDKNIKAYLLIKRDGEWTVIARANIVGEGAVNPFEKPNKYRIYSIENVENTNPFAISDLLREEFGNTYGLTLRAPNLISAERFIRELEKRFIVG